MSRSRLLASVIYGFNMGFPILIHSFNPEDEFIYAISAIIVIILSAIALFQIYNKSDGKISSQEISVCAITFPLLQIFGILLYNFTINPIL